MQTLDATIVLAFNGFARRSWGFDAFVLLLAETALFKAGVLVALLWWTWERVGAKRPAPPVVLTLAGAVAASATTRMLQNWLPARPRPLYDPALDAAGFVPPYTVPPDALRDWSSFPSDTAALAFALATAVFLAHRGAGAFAYAWALFAVCLPRVYAGYHYPSDILCGAAIGLALMAAAACSPVPPRVGAAAARWGRTHRGWFYAGLFLITHQMATVFTDARIWASFVARMLAAVWHGL